jgi:drug/metabolite transporter (DMT)-like permease
LDRAAIAEISAIFLWALGNVFIAHLSFFFDNFTQNFFRYISAATLLLFFSLTFYRGRYLASFRYLKNLFALAVVVFLFQIFYVEGIVLASPTIGSLITRLSVVFVDLLSFLLFPEERALVRNTRFIIGTIIALIGVFGVALSGSGLFYAGSAFLGGILSLLVASALWAAYIITLRVSLRTADPLSITTNTYLISGIMFAPFLVTYGNFYKIFEVGAFVALYLVLSGFISVGVGNLLNSYAIQRMGASLPANLQLLLPVFTGALSFLILKEPMPLAKLTASALTLLGCWLILSVNVDGNSSAQKSF